MKVKLVQFLSLFLLLLVTGVFWGTWFPLTRSIEGFSAEEFIHIGKVIIANVAVPMSIMMPSCILLMILTLWFYTPKKAFGFYLGVTALMLIIITLLITLLILVPIDNHINEWTASTVPADWEAIRSRWQLFHTVRTLTSLASFGCFALAIMNSKNDIKQ